MSKKNALDPRKVETIINGYLQALELAKGEQAVNMTDLYYAKGWFYLRPMGMSKEAQALPYRPHEIQTLTSELLKNITI